MGFNTQWLSILFNQMLNWESKSNTLVSSLCRHEKLHVILIKIDNMLLTLLTAFLLLQMYSPELHFRRLNIMSTGTWCHRCSKFLPYLSKFKFGTNTISPILSYLSVCGFTTMSRKMTLSKSGYGLNKSLVIGGILNDFIDSNRQANPRV